MTKKILLVAVLAVASVMAYAGPRAIGGRLGAFSGVSYEHAIGENNMIEVELGYSIDGQSDFWTKYGSTTTHSRGFGSTVQAAATYDWIDPFGATFPAMPKGEWHWYMGAGLAAGFGWYGYAYVPSTYSSTGIVGSTTNWGFVAPCGRIGVEYDFWFPLQLSIDYRPTLGVGLWEKTGTSGVQSALYWEMTCLALGVRYKF